MGNENTTFEFRFKKIAETRNQFSEEVKHNELISKKRKKTLISVCPCSYPAGITSSAVELKVFVITAGIKKYKQFSP